MTRYAGGPDQGRAPPDGSVPFGKVEAFLKRAEAKMLAHTRRFLQIDTTTIRQYAIPDCITLISHGLSFSRFVIANLVAIGVVVVLALAAISGEPPRLGALRDGLAQIIARFFAGP